MVLQSGVGRRWFAVQDLEAAGVDHVWVADHLRDSSRPDLAWFDGWTTLAGLAQATSTVRLGPLVTSITFRHPVMVAKMCQTVDAISGGRLELGIGAAGRGGDAAMLGVAAWSPGERASRFAEFVEVVSGLLEGSVSSSPGPYWRFADTVLGATGVQQPRPPLTIAAHGRRTIAVAARHAYRWNTLGGFGLSGAAVLGAVRDQCDQLDEACAACGRDPATIRRSLLMDYLDDTAWSTAAEFEDVVGRYGEVGIDGFITYDQWAGHVERDPDEWLSVVGSVMPLLRHPAA
jgi:alkanesulfonate monooxygenase SsuD/methylene tetrahydromethanopterin reductase-like flavin-dependent oxidoreductase (luciferase family)